MRSIVSMLVFLAGFLICMVKGHPVKTMQNNLFKNLWHITGAKSHSQNLLRKGGAADAWHARSRAKLFQLPRARREKLGMVASMAATAPDIPVSLPLVWNEAPDNSWTFNGWPDAPGLTVNYIVAGPVDAQPFLLIHGFGASGFHWRRNVNVLAAAGYRVYAIDLIGFGLSSKPVIDYDSRLWREQCATFLREVVGCGEGGKRAIVAGNSIGGYTALMVGAKYPELTLGVASLNGAGRFSPSPEEAEALRAAEAAKAERNDLQVAVDSAVEKLGVSLQRTAAYLGLFVTKQPLRIKQVLQQVYPVSPEAADNELVESIVYAAEDAPGLAPPGKIPEVFYRIVSRNGRGGTFTVDELIEKLKVPLLLLWGEKDPWVVSEKGDRAQACAQAAGIDVRRVSVNAGHCPQDEAPEAVNKGLLDFAKELHSSGNEFNSHHKVSL